MAVCALVSARVRDKALFNPVWDVEDLLDPASEIFYDAAGNICASMGAKQEGSHDLMRACSLQALTAIQYGRIRDMQTYLGNYHTLVAMDGLHDETNWPQDIGIIEIEERRRLVRAMFRTLRVLMFEQFWSMYTLDIFTSIVWNGVIRCREQQSNVSYPTELDDELISDQGYNQEVTSPVDIGPSPGDRPGVVKGSSWLCGWNFTTDLYRLLEHVIIHFRDRKRHRRTFINRVFGDATIVSASSVKDDIMAMYANLPQCFKEIKDITYDTSR